MKYAEKTIIEAMDNLQYEPTQKLTFAEFRGYFYKSLLWEQSKTNDQKEEV